MLRALFVHAHYDDYEFTTAGTWELWRRRLGSEFKGRVLVCTDGSAGHHFRSRAETSALRMREQEASALLGQFEFRPLRLQDGRIPREACLQITTPLLAALWKAIREFEPDYLFCPPSVTDPLAGLHNDHQVVADAVRRVAYMINVPHAFLEEYPADETRSVPCRAPVIVHVYDGYQFGANSFDLATDTESAFDLVSELTWRHASQVREWLPWVGRHQMAPPEDLEAWKKTLRARFVRRNRELGIPPARYTEVFGVTAWGEIPTLEQLQRDWPSLDPESSRLEALGRRLRLWRGE
ncbi:MAG: PIG-L family deacetylase [Verrucomicrobia bacterium]|nr:PIG-L family deacetylase [Verrucomicrobiota bacterium]MBI3867100.1 PIG-L family deacetylase [Verrucomicrobiota bacterium]